MSNGRKIKIAENVGMGRVHEKWERQVSPRELPLHTTEDAIQKTAT
jgi:hypothetical protein